MSRYRLPREFFIPKGARKVAHNHSSAVVYVYANSKGEPCAVAFHGKADKPDWRFRFPNQAAREKRVTSHFASIQAWEEARVQRRADRKAQDRGLAVGDVLKTCWGYEQTNVEWFEITALIGKAMVEIREIACDAEETQWLQGKTVPIVGRYIGEPLRRMARKGAVKIDQVRTAWKVEPLATIGDKAVYPAAHYTAYH